jgi:hypothetical protein
VRYSREIPFHAATSRLERFTPFHASTFQRDPRAFTLTDSTA